MPNLRRAALIGLLLLAGCTPGTPVEGDNNTIKYVHDAQHGVGCWTIYGSGIDCIPDTDYIYLPGRE